MNSEYRASIVSYYDKTRLDYRWLWLNRKNRSVHFGFYDEGVSKHSQALENLNRVMAQKANIKRGDQILDAGCGQGGSALWLSEQYGVNVDGITLVPHQVKIARKTSEKRKLSNLTSFSVQDYCNTNYADESFDVIWACESMCHAEHKRSFYKEAYRLLKKGGQLIAADYIRSARPLENSEEALLHDWLDGWSIKDLDTKNEHFEHMQAVGFVDQRVEDVTANTRPSLQHLHSMSSKLWKFGKVLKGIGLRNDVNHGNQIGSIKQYEALEQKLWYYGIISAQKK